MSCDCAKCRQHYRTLGFTYGAPTQSEIQDAYQEMVKQWHPDLYVDYASLRAEAEDRFKQIQLAYRELNEHNSVSVAVESTPESVPVDGVAKKIENAPAISFGGAPGCLVGSQITAEIEQRIASHLGADKALAIIDFGGDYSHFFLLATRGIMVRDTRNIISLLKYEDLGEVNFIDKRQEGKQGFWQKLAGAQPGCSLQIYRNNGTHFFSFTDQVDDSVKRVIYDFLMSKKRQ
jgi:hypothetical protein